MPGGRGALQGRVPGGGGTLPVAGEIPRGKGASPVPAGPGTVVCMVVPGRLRQDGGSDSIPMQTAPVDSQNPLRGLHTVPPTHWA